MTHPKPTTLLVGLDLSEMDYYLIRYLNQLEQHLKLEKVIFFHNIKLGELPDGFVLPKRLEMVQAKINEKIRVQVEKSGPKYNFETIVTAESYSASAFFDFIKKQPVDLLVMGNKQNLEGNGSLPRKLLGMVPPSVLMVPETYRAPITGLLEAIDFSKYTPAIMDWAARFTSNNNGDPIRHSAVHISKSFWEEHYPSQRMEKMEEATQAYTQRKKAKWEERYATFGTMEIVQAQGRSISTALLQYADKKRANILLLGVLGSYGIREIFIGSVANRLLGRMTNTCLLFVKHKR